MIYLSQSFYKTPKDIGLNCSHYCLYEFPSSREANRISSELGVDKEIYRAATKKPFTFLYVDNDMNKKKLTNVAAPTDNEDAATKKYVDDNSSG